MWIFSPGHAGVLGKERADVLPESAEIRRTQIMDAVRATVQEMLTFIHTSWASQATSQPDTAGDSQHPHPKERYSGEGSLYGLLLMMIKTSNDGFKVFQSI